MRPFRTIAFAAACAFALDTPPPRPLPQPPPPTGPVAASCEGSNADLTIISFNAGLGPGMMPLSTPRSPHVAAAVAGTDFDLLCLQEIWTAPEQQQVLDALGLSPTQTLAADTTDLLESAGDRCEPGELESVISCAESECGASTTEEQTLCALNRCQRDLTFLYLRDRRCLDCLTAHVGQSVREIGQACTGGSASHVYGGRNGVILASRWRLYDKDVLILPASDTNRVALFARVLIPGRGPVEVACAHLSAPQRIPPDHPGFADWEEEQIAQLRLISARLAERAADGVPQFLVGDLNFGPWLGDDLEAASPRAWQESLDQGFTSPGASVQPPFCSLCPENTIRGPYAGHLVDHALMRDPPGGLTVAPRCADRLFTAPADITGYGGEPVRTNLSDHYGVRVRFDFH